MFCPKCRGEYREGFYTCADCQVSLVEELAPEPEPEYYEFIELMTVFEEASIALIKSLFDEAGLEYYFQGELSRHLVPLPFSTRLMVRKDHVSKAKWILRELESTEEQG